MKRILFFFIFFISFFIFLLSDVGAISISPATITIDFQSNLEQTHEVKVINTRAESVDVELSIDFGGLFPPSDNELANSVVLEENEFTLDALSSKSVNFDLSLPSEMSEPGFYKIRIIAREKPKEEGMIGISMASSNYLLIKNPFAGKYLSLKLISPSEARINELIQLSAFIQNDGTETIDKIIGDFNILNDKGETVDSLPIDEHLSFLSSKTTQLNTDWTVPKDMSAGEYSVVATLDYAAESVSDEKKITIIGGTALPPKKSTEFVLGGESTTSEKKSNLGVIIAIVFLILVVIALVILFISMRKKTGGQAGSSTNLQPTQPGQPPVQPVQASPQQPITSTPQTQPSQPPLQPASQPQF